MIEKSANKIAKCWQKLLRLEDWDVTVEVIMRHEMESHDNLGECHADPLERTATIRILNPIELPEADQTAEYLEKIIIHELLHLIPREASLADGENVEEIIVRKMTRVIVGLLEVLR